MSRTTTPEYRENSSIAKERDRHKCVNCRKDHDLQSHHIKLASSGGSDHHSNLVTLCNACHWKLHKIGENRSDMDRLEPRLLGDWKPSDDDWRHPGLVLNQSQSQVHRVIKNDGPLKRSDIVERVEYGAGTVGSVLSFLHSTGIIQRVERGVYEYVPCPPESPGEVYDNNYDEMLSRRDDLEHSGDRD
jgi:hypothetical protein